MFMSTVESIKAVVFTDRFQPAREFASDRPQTTARTVQGAQKVRRNASAPCRARCIIALLAIVLAGAVSAQTYPTRPLRILTAETGGGSDIVARILSHVLSPALGQQIVVENRVGGVIVADIAARATPDGYTLLLYSNSLWLLPFMRESTPYDAVRDFAPVCLVMRTPGLLVVHPSVPVTSVAELVALARAKPGELNYASGPTGASPHLAGELFKAMARVEIERIAFKGVGLALNDVMAGRVQMMFSTPSSSLQYVKAGRLRALATTGAEPSPLLPSLPTVASAGLPGFELMSMFGVFVPAQTPPALVARLNSAIVAVVRAPEMKGRLTNIGVEAVGSTPAELRDAMHAEMNSIGKVIKDRGIRAE